VTAIAAVREFEHNRGCGRSTASFVFPGPNKANYEKQTTQ
jgi:hypothetical protein